ncbi:hypothetical protein [Alteromonas sp. a30]|uniref:hypothetical protein n=1 Tax=Alteromonas sp. a30 TaxID=2730917 RepID=UPI002281581C|nr:hypothetical protein [Alteromonas sp. a30]MCY7297425.1 hypothetical protein [Alteromonas sp. a30]
MKKIIVSLVLFYLSFSAASSTRITPDVNNPVVALLGASLVDPEASPNNTVGLTSLNGSSYRGIADYLKAESINEADGIVYREQAEGGATTNGKNGFLSILEQAQRVIEHTTQWSDGTHTKAAVLFRFNDCLHSIAGICENKRDVLNIPVANTLEVIHYLQSQDILVIVPQLPSYDDMDLPLLEERFREVVPDFRVATEAQYHMLKSTFEDEVGKIPGVVMLDIWGGMQHIGDGLHPNHNSKKQAAKKLHQHLQHAFKAQ